jgi:hypothetical protein
MASSVRPKTDRRKKSTAGTDAVVATATNPNAEIARRAYELYVARGGQHGSDLDDWLRAERELAAPRALQGRTTRKASTLD